MTTITVSASKTYEVHIGSGLLSRLGNYTANLCKPCKVVIVSDTTVWPLYGPAAEASLADAGFHVLHYLFDAGEASKNGQTFLSILNFLAENQLTRSDLIVALGGGVTGDMAGFVAATYQRGIRYIQVPTTLLAMVDSSVGGKTAIDLPAGKNLAGAFYQPIMVLCDLDVLNSLPRNIFLDGCAEVIKYGILFDAELFSHLEGYGPEFHREEVISRCIQWKRDVVAQDEFEAGLRQKLNLGHTVGHGVEKQSNFTISHGSSVAIGMAIIARAFCEDSLSRRICQILEQFSLPVRTVFTAQQLYTASLTDKKRSGEMLHLIVPEQIGSCKIKPISVHKLLSYIEAGL